MKNQNDFIKVHKARVHNLKDVSVNIPKNTLTVITGPSGSGKSSLAFDTIYAEGQRRYIESLSSYARQFLGQQQAPDVESITGLSPAIAIDQKTTNKNPRSTVGTITEVYDYLRVLFARAGDLYCPESGEIIRSYTPGQITTELLKNKEKTKLQIMIQIAESTIKATKDQVSKYRAMGFSRFMVDGEVNLLEDADVNKLKASQEIYCVIDRVLVKDGVEKRLTDSIEYAYKLGNGIAHIAIEDEIKRFSEHNLSPITGERYPDLEPRLFSFNSPVGACPECNGLAESKKFDIDSLIFDDNLPILSGSIPAILKKNSFLNKMVETVCKEEKIDLKIPLKEISKKHFDIIFNGTDKVYKYKFKSENSNFEFSKPFPGILDWFDKKYKESSSEKVRIELENYMKIKLCSSCNGRRLNPIALSTKINDKNIIDLCEVSIGETQQIVEKIQFDGIKAQIAEKLLKEIKNRLSFLVDVGLDYLTLNRSAGSLSGGEAQRIRLATQIGSALSGVLYVLDEPSIGLHQRDNVKLIQTLKDLRDLGNTVLVVEHDEDTMMASDFIIDIGPGAGVHGGEIVALGTKDEFIKAKNSITAKYLNEQTCIPVPKERKPYSETIKLKGATQNNIKNLDIEIPHGILTCITGVSGSGKSTLVHEILIPAVKTSLTRANKSLYDKKNYKTITGISKFKSVIELDQSPIGRTPHSNPATYTGLFDDIRKLYAMTPESQIRGYKQGRFSFNVKGGRCEECEGNGVKKIEMHFLPDVFVTCPECNGKRYNNETLSVLYRGKNIADVLEMTIEEGYEFFSNHPRVSRILKTMNDVGLGYMRLGQPATTLSGGEAQRLKLSTELAKKTKGHTLYVLDEPTTGLHFEDVKVLLKAINSLVDQGNTVLTIEHNLDVIKVSDHIIDLGPEGGSGGGQIVAIGTPEEVSKIKNSHTGFFLKKVLKK
ncbi:excinuclease ABC subunit UvrA [Bacteriovorax sp. Seq25_V]|uniref:excinuclease ABC subunit UvrA n=1 Tax=Bacteriovorax sp. Seq25_V TaxID=1201288 RepID=UPI00038A3AC0|nr:excinuclease ABC subunit UvrA [Bacteriovorax sp. Seq25_V]EQC43488.1 excinuclease ABC, A subunit [Bacteriovorax sp. Seq25_V]